MVATTPNANRWTDEQRINALSRISQGESQRSISRDTGIPQPTIANWSAKAHHAELEKAPSRANGDRKRPLVKEINYGELWAEAQRLGAQVIAKGLNQALNQEEPIRAKDLQHYAISAGIAVDKHLDYRDGRKGTQITVDARSVQLPPGLTVEELRMLALGSGPTLELAQGDQSPPEADTLSSP